MSLSTLSKTMLASLMVLGSGFAQAITVNIDSAEDGFLGALLFDATQTVAMDSADPNVSIVEVGINSFTPGATLAGVNAFDTTTTVFSAPEGYVITGIQFFEEVTFEVENGLVIGEGSMTIDSTTVVPLQNTILLLTNTNISDTVLFDSGFVALDNVDTVETVITNQLTQLVTSPGGTAYIEKTSAYFEVTLAQVPVPPALWMMGSALVGLVAVRRKRTS